MTGWRELAGELDRWHEDGRVATFWWRDDDAMRQSAALDRLIEIRNRWRVPLVVAVVPRLMEATLPSALGGVPGVAIAQHGFAHDNHAPAGAKKSELGPHRSMADVTRELAEGRRALDAAFADRSIAVLVPPWNRIDDQVVAALPSLGYAGLSRFRARAGRDAAPGVAEVNAHVDIIDWRGGRGFIGEAAALDAAISHLSARRTGTADCDESTGLLTHHAAHDEGCWRFVAEFLGRTAAHPGARWVSAGDLFGPLPGLQ